MRTIKGAAEALVCLKEGEILTTDGKDRFILKKDRVYCYESGTRFSVPAEDFLQLYQKNSFFIEEETVEIDESKDEAYYRYYRK